MYQSYVNWITENGGHSLKKSNFKERIDAIKLSEKNLMKFNSQQLVSVMEYITNIVNILEINGNYLPTGSIFGGKTDLLSFGEMFIGGLGSLLQISVSDMYIYSSLLIGIGILYLLQKIFWLDRVWPNWI